MSANYSDSKNPPMPPVEKVSSFKPGANPAASFGKGAGSLAEIQKSADAVRQRSAELSRMPTGPRTPGSRDNG
jgi:hypothetical protein